LTRVWIALALLATILTLAFTEYKICGELSGKLTQLADTAEQYSTTGKNTEQLCIKMQELWSDKKNTAEIFLNHNDADNIDNLIEEMIRYSRLNDHNRIYADCGELKNRLLSLKETESVNWHNIL